MRKELTYEEHNLPEGWQEYTIVLPTEEIDSTIAMLNERVDPTSLNHRVRNIRIGKDVPDEVTDEQRLQACEAAIIELAEIIGDM